jgi:hypothetical protein
MTTVEQTSGRTPQHPQLAASAATLLPEQKQTKKQQLQAFLEQEDGASLLVLQTTFGWQPHTVRAAISGLRKAGHTVIYTSSPSGPIYRIAQAASAQ